MSLVEENFSTDLVHEVIDVFKTHRISPNKGISICAFIIGMQAEMNGWTDESVIEQFVLNLAVGRANAKREERRLS